MEEIFQIMRDHIAQSYKNKFENLNEMDNFLGMQFYKIDPSRKKKCLNRQISIQVLKNISKN